MSRIHAAIKDFMPPPEHFGIPGTPELRKKIRIITDVLQGLIQGNIMKEGKPLICMAHV